MLGKLINYEFSATRRLILPLYLVMVAMSILNRIVLSIKFKGALKLIPGSIMTLYVITLVVGLAITVFYLISRFYKNYMTDEGYLMFTLPVNSHQLTLSKLIPSIIWTIATVIMILLSILIVVYTPDRMDIFFTGLDALMSKLRMMFGETQTTILIIQLGIAMFIGIVYSTLMIYFSISLGQLFNGHKIIGAFGAYMGLYTIMQIISALTFVVFGNVYINNTNDVSIIYNLILPASIILSLILSTIYYFGIQYIFKHKLNLE